LVCRARRFIARLYRHYFLFWLINIIKTKYYILFLGAADPAGDSSILAQPTVNVLNDVTQKSQIPQ